MKTSDPIVGPGCIMLEILARARVEYMTEIIKRARLDILEGG